ncbi:MAG: MBG domain-containing protein, partial [Lentisphaerota bacterium]
QSASLGDTTFTAVYTYNPAGAIHGPYVWSETASLPTELADFGLATFNGGLYALGGYDAGLVARTNAYRFDGTNWAEVVGLPEARSGLGAATLFGHLLAMGGAGGGDFTTNLYVFDGANWTEGLGLPISAATFGADIFSNNLLVAGGGNISTLTNAFQFDGASWTELSGMPDERNRSAAGALIDHFYVAGGDDASGDAKTNVYGFNGTGWEEVAGLPAMRAGAAGAVWDSKLYVIGGYDEAEAAHTNVWAFDGTQWSEVAGLPGPRQFLKAGVLNGTLYAVGGMDDTWSVTYSNVYAYEGGLGGVEPSSGSVTGGYPVAISGSNLGNGSDITNVTICGVAVQSIESQSATQVMAVAGVRTAGTGDVRVFSISFGETVKSNAFTYERMEQDTLIFTPASPQAYLTTNALSISGGSGTGLITYAVLSGPGQIVDDTNLAITSGTGMVTVVATKAQDDWYYVASATALVAAAKADQSILFAPISSQYIANHVQLTASSGSGLPVSFAVDSGPGSIADDTNLTFSSVGIVRIVASQAGDADWDAAPDVTNEISVYDFSENSGPAAGGNSLIVTNGSALGNGSDITNVTICGIQATITGQGENWVRVTLGAGPAGGTTGDIIIQSESSGERVFDQMYTYNPVGCIYDNLDAGWTEMTGLPDALNLCGGGVFNGQLHALGRRPSGSFTNVYAFDGTNWMEISQTPVPRTDPFVGVMGNRLYVLGGQYFGTWQTNVYAFDGTNWMEVAGLPESFEGMACASLNGRLYVAGGSETVSAYTNARCFDGTNWTAIAGLPSGRAFLGMGAFNGNLYAMGGLANGDFGMVTYYQTAFRYDGLNWSAVADIPREMAYISAEAFNEGLYSVGGGDYYSAYTNVFRFDGTNWAGRCGLPAQRKKLVVGAMNGFLYAAGGVEGSFTYKTNVYRYQTDSFGVIPNSGSVTGGFHVTISGLNLCDGSDVTNVTLCGVSAQSIESQSATQIVVVADGGDAGLGDVRVYSISFGETVKSNAFTYERMEQDALTFTPVSPQAYLATNALSTSGGSGTGLITYVVLSGPGQIVDDTNLAITSGTGMVTVVATKAQDDWYYATVATAHVAAAKALQVITNFPNPGPQETTNVITLTAQAESGLACAFSVLSGPGEVLGSTLTFTNAGNVSVVASQAGDANWNAASDVTNTFSVTKANASLTITNTSQVYTGSPCPVGAETVPADLNTLFSYDGSGTAPTVVGLYAVTGTIVEAMYQGLNTATLTITKATAGVHLGSLSQTYDGAAKSVTATSDPSGLTIEFTYNGNAWAPTNAGSYAVTGTVNDANYQGSADEILIIGQASQTIGNFAPTNGSVFVETNAVGLSASASSGLPVSFTTHAGPGWIAEGTNLTFSHGGLVSIAAFQPGDLNYAEAPALTNEYQVLGIYTVVVSSLYGTSALPVGSYTYLQGSMVTNHTLGPDTQDTTQYVCGGWTMIGNDPVSGVTTGFVMTVTNDARLDWCWSTNYWLATEAGPHAQVMPSAWHAYGSTAMVMALAVDYYQFTNWTGDVPSGQENDHTIYVLMSAPRTVRAWAAAICTTNRPTPQWWLAEYGFTSNFEEAVTNDADGDGVLTSDEYLADTCPTNDDSYLRMEWIGSERVSWVGGTGVLQYLERATVFDESWMTLNTNIPPTSITNDLPVGETSPQFFYRIRAVR